MPPGTNYRLALTPITLEKIQDSFLFSMYGEFKDQTGHPTIVSGTDMKGISWFIKG